MWFPTKQSSKTKGGKKEHPIHTPFTSCLHHEKISSAAWLPVLDMGPHPHGTGHHSVLYKLLQLSSPFTHVLACFTSQPLVLIALFGPPILFSYPCFPSWHANSWIIQGHLPSSILITCPYHLRMTCSTLSSNPILIPASCWIYFTHCYTMLFHMWISSSMELWLCAFITSCRKLHSMQSSNTHLYTTQTSWKYLH